MPRLSFFKSEFSRNTSTLFWGTAAAQAIPLLLQPFLRRMYSPEDFGAMAVYLTLFGIITIASSLRYEAAVVLPKGDDEAANIVSLSFIINLIFCLAILLVVLFFRMEISDVINLPEKYSAYLVLLPFACFAFSFFQNLNYWLIRHKAFKASANNKVARRGTEGIVQVICGFLKVPGGLFIGDLAGNAANVIAGIFQSFRNGFNLKIVSWKQIKEAWNKYSYFPKYNLFPTFLSSAATVLPFLLVNKYYSTETAGQLDLTRMVLSIPLIFIATSVSQVFFQQVTQKKHNMQSIKKDVLQILYFLLIIIATEFAIVLPLGPVIFELVFGEPYAVSGYFSQILVFSFAMNFIGSAFSSVFITFEQIRMNSIWQVFYFVAICSLLFFTNWDIYDFLKVYMLIEIIMHAVYCMMIYFIVNRHEETISSKRA